MSGHYALDSRGLWFACKALCVLLLMASATRYGIALASEQLAQKDEALSAAAASIPEQPSMPKEESGPALRDVPVPDVAAGAYLVGDVESGKVLASRNADTSLPIASISKLLTALVVSDEIPGDATIGLTDGDRAQTEGTPGRLPTNATFRAADLLYPLLMESNNTVAFAFARSHSAFVEKMNQKAGELGMGSSTFVEPTGLSAKNVSSARDLFTLLRHLMTERRDLLSIARTAKHPIVSTKGRTYDVPNFNVFVSETSFLGGKTGYTEDANQTMASLFSIDGRTIAIVVLGTPDRKRDIDLLRRWIDDALDSRE